MFSPSLCSFLLFAAAVADGGGIVVDDVVVADVSAICLS